MQPFLVAEKVKDAYRRYIETSFPIRREALRPEFDRLIAEETLLWQEFPLHDRIVPAEGTIACQTGIH